MLDSFPLFMRLPPELRFRVYSLAIERRVVVVEERLLDEHWDLFYELEDEDVYYEDEEAAALELYKEQFVKNLLIPSHDLELDSSLMHFAHLWRDAIPYESQRRRRKSGQEMTILSRPGTGEYYLPGLQQTPLESFGFTGAQRRGVPWTPSEKYPDIPLRWLATEPEVCWALCRRMGLGSTTKIPALLHTCRESRSALTWHGYELAFRTRSCGPQTWFCFEHDILYLKASRDNYRGDWQERNFALKICDWEVGIFHPDDMVRVRHLALDESEECLNREAYSLCWVFPSLKKLYFPLIHPSEWERFFDDRAMDGFEAFDDYDVTEGGSGAQDSLPVKPCDVVLALFLSTHTWQRESFAEASGKLEKWLELYPGHGNGLFDHRRHRRRDAIQSHVRQVVSSDERFELCKIPQIRLLHIFPQIFKQRIQRARDCLLQLNAEARRWISSTGKHDRGQVLPPQQLFSEALKHGSGIIPSLFPVPLGPSYDEYLADEAMEEAVSAGLIAAEEALKEEIMKVEREKRRLRETSLSLEAYEPASPTTEEGYYYMHYNSDYDHGHDQASLNFSEEAWVEVLNRWMYEIDIPRPRDSSR